MTDAEIKKKVREEIANIVRYAEDNFILISDKDRKILYDIADQILSIDHLNITSDEEALVTDDELKTLYSIASGCPIDRIPIPQVLQLLVAKGYRRVIE